MNAHKQKNDIIDTSFRITFHRMTGRIGTSKLQFNAILKILGIYFLNFSSKFNFLNNYLYSFVFELTFDDEFYLQLAAKILKNFPKRKRLIFHILQKAMTFRKIIDRAAHAHSILDKSVCSTQG